MPALSIIFSKEGFCSFLAVLDATDSFGEDDKLCLPILGLGLCHPPFHLYWQYLVYEHQKTSFFSRLLVKALLLLGGISSHESNQVTNGLNKKQPRTLSNFPVTKLRRRVFNTLPSRWQRDYNRLLRNYFFLHREHFKQFRVNLDRLIS